MEGGGKVNSGFGCEKNVRSGREIFRVYINGRMEV